MEQQTLLAICCFLLCSKGVVVSALSVTSTPTVTGVNGGNAEFKISYAMGSGETFTKVVLKKWDGSYLFEAPYFMPPSTINVDGVFHSDFKSRGSTDYSHGKTNFTITLSQVTPDDEGQYTVAVGATGGKVKSSKSQLVVDYTIKPTGSGEGGDTTKPTRSGEGGDTTKPTGSGEGGDTTKPTGSGEGGDTVKPTGNGEGGDTTKPTGSGEGGDTVKPTENGKGGDTVKPTGNGEGGDTVKPTENGKGGDTVKPTGNGEGGVSAECHDIPNKIVLGAAFVVMAMISTII